jgi:hypothetical protein
MWSNRWVKVAAVGLGFFVINAISRLISLATQPDEEPSVLGPVDDTGQTVLAVVGALLVVALMTGAAAWWSVRHPIGRVVADLGLATLIGTVLSLLIGPLVVGDAPFAEGLESFVYQFLQFLGLGALGILLGFSAMTVLGKDWRSRGLAAYVDRHGKKATPAPGTRRR